MIDADHVLDIGKPEPAPAKGPRHDLAAGERATKPLTDQRDVTV